MSDVAPSLKTDAATALPAALSELTTRVVRKARLWPSEKRDVRAELESHFREGLIELAQEGLSTDESVAILRDGFGDPDLAAALIRRGKKRGRPMLWKLIVGAAMTTFGGLGAGASYLAYLYFATPSPKVDFVSEINKPVIRTAESDRAWPIMHDVILQLKMTPGTDQVRGGMPLPGEATWPEAMTWVSENRHLLPTIIEASRKPAYGFIYNNKTTGEFLAQRAIARGEPAFEASEDDPLMPPTIMILLPHLSDYRDAGRLLVLDARDRFYHGDFAAGWTSVDAAHRLGAQLFEGQTLIEQLVGRAIMAMATQEMRRVLFTMRDRITADQLQMVMDSHLMTMPAATLTPNFEGEKLFFQDIVQYLFTDDGNGDGHLIPKQIAKIQWTVTDAPSGTVALQEDAKYLHIAAVHAGRQETLDKYFEVWRQMKERLDLPLYDYRRDDVGRILDGALDGDVKGRYFVIKLLLPNLSRADAAIREAAIEQQAARAIVAILQYRLDNGRLPARLNDLVPAYLEEVPLDGYSGEPLRYDPAAASGPLLYSVGADRTDDGGSRDEVTSTNVGRPVTKDIVYWPETLNK